MHGRYLHILIFTIPGMMHDPLHIHTHIHKIHKIHAYMFIFPPFFCAVFLRKKKKRERELDGPPFLAHPLFPHFLLLSFHSTPHSIISSTYIYVAASIPSRPILCPISYYTSFACYARHPIPSLFYTVTSLSEFQNAKK